MLYENTSQSSSYADPENSAREVLTNYFFSHQCISKRDVQTSLELAPRGSVPVFLRNIIATCKFSRGVVGPPSLVRLCHLSGFTMLQKFLIMGKVTHTVHYLVEYSNM